MAYENYRPPSSNLLPLVIKNLFILNGLFLLATFVVQQQLGVNLEDTLGLHLPNASKFRPYQLITYMFMHADIHHLLSNMLTLWFFGTMLENFWGPKRFLIYYVLTGVGAALFYNLILYYQTYAPLVNAINAFQGYGDPLQFLEFFHKLPAVHYSADMHLLANNYDQLLDAKSINPSVVTDAAQSVLSQYKIDLLNGPVIIGASGSVFGVLLAYGMLFPNSYPIVFFPIKAKWIVLIYGLGEFVAEFQAKPGDNVAHVAHLGGMLFGFILIKYWQRKSKHFY